MKQTVDFYMFAEAFNNMRPNNFSSQGLQALFDYLDELEDSLADEFELDVIAFCGEYSEYESLEEFQLDFGEEYKSLEDIENKTTVIMIDDESFIIQVF